MIGRPLQRALIVDDDEGVALALTSLLALNGISVRVLERGVGAVRLVADYRPDLVILDIGLPDADGRIVCAEIRQISDVPVLLVSAAEQAPSSMLPSVAFLQKPFTHEELNEALQSLGFAVLR